VSPEVVHDDEKGTWQISEKEMLPLRKVASGTLRDASMLGTKGEFTKPVIGVTDVSVNSQVTSAGAGVTSTMLSIAAPVRVF